MFPGRPNAPAVVSRTRKVDHRWLTERATEIKRRLRSVANAPDAVHALRAVGLWIDDPAELVASVAAVARTGADAFLVPPGATPERVRQLGVLEGASVLITDDARADLLHPAARYDCGSTVVLVGSPSHHQLHSQHPHDGGAVHFFTSGTEGRIKGVVRTLSALGGEALSLAERRQTTVGTVVLCAVPVSHSYGFTSGLFGPLAVGATVVVEQPRFASSLAKVLALHRPELVLAVPAQYAAWSALRERYNGPMPRLWVSSGAPLAPRVRQRFEAAWGAVISEQYGMTECGGIAIDVAGSGSLGLPYPGVSVDIESDGGPGSEGEVVVRSPYGPCCYLGATAADPRIRVRAGKLRTGDTGWLDRHGELNLVGRRAHQINVRGQKVDPVEVERVLWALDGVHDVAVVGVDRSVGDQWVAAFVVCADTVSNDALHLATAPLATYKRPQRFFRLPALPKTSSGKTDVLPLRDMVRPHSGPDS